MGFREEVNLFCATLPGSRCSDPWGSGHDAWKVAGKIYACFGAIDRGIAVKTADIDTALHLIEIGLAARAPYFHRSWVLVSEIVGIDEARHRVQVSYQLIVAKFPRKTRAQLAVF